MNDTKFSELSKLKQEIEELQRFKNCGEKHWIQAIADAFGQLFGLETSDGPDSVKYKLSKELHDEVLLLLQNHLAGLKKKFEEG